VGPRADSTKKKKTAVLGISCMIRKCYNMKIVAPVFGSITGSRGEVSG